MIEDLLRHISPHLLKSHQKHTRMYGGICRVISIHQRRPKTKSIDTSVNSLHQQNHFDFDLPTLSDGAETTDELAGVKAALESLLFWLIRRDSGAVGWLRVISDELDRQTLTTEASGTPKKLAVIATTGREVSRAVGVDIGRRNYFDR